MKLREISELHLAAIVAAATLVGGLISSLADAYLIDASTERMTDVQLVELAIGILSTPLSDEARASASNGRSSPTNVLREWAVDTVNAAATVKFSPDVRELLTSGGTVLKTTPFISEVSEVYRELLLERLDRDGLPAPRAAPDPRAPQ